MNNALITPKLIEEVEQIVSNIMDDIIDGSGPDDIMAEMDDLLRLVGSKKVSEDLSSY